MKKRTNEEKLQMVSDACRLIGEAKEKVKEAEKLMHLCGIEICSINIINTIPADMYNDVQIYKGIKNLQKITEKELYFKKSYLTNKDDKSIIYLDFAGLTMCQLGEERTSTQAKFTFK